MSIGRREKFRADEGLNVLHPFREGRADNAKTRPRMTGNEINRGKHGMKSGMAKLGSRSIIGRWPFSNSLQHTFNESSVTGRSSSKSLALKLKI
jgi:hypothetical protein